MTETPAPESAPNTDAPPTPEDKQPAESGTDWQAEARKWEARAKENKDARARLEQIERASMSESERLTAELAQIAQQRDEASTELARLRAALKHGLDMSDLDLLGSGPAEDIEARAKRLAARLAETSAPRKPQPDPSQGRHATSGASTADQFAAALGGVL